MTSRSSKRTTSRPRRPERRPRRRPPAAPADTVEVGVVRRPHGVRGELRVEVTSDVPGRFAPGAVLLLRRPDGTASEVTVESAREGEGALLLRLAGIADRDAAGALRGAVFEVPRSAVPPAPEDVYYHFELVGCRCVDAAAGDLGTVADLVDDGGGVLLLVTDGDRELLVPFVRDLVPRVDVAGKRLDLRLPPGLLETCASTSSPSSPSSSRPS